MLHLNRTKYVDLLCMKQKNYIALLLTGLFLMNLMAAHIGGLTHIFSEENVVIFNPFCLKSNFISLGDDAEITNSATEAPIAIPAICNLELDIKKPSFTILFAEDNFKTYVFNDKFQSNLFSVRYYLPPQV